MDHPHRGLTAIDDRQARERALHDSALPAIELESRAAALRDLERL
jgi:hypothetical protein